MLPKVAKEKTAPKFEKVDSFDKNGSNILFFQKLWFDDPKDYFVDIREFYKTDGKTLVTKKGISIKPDTLKQLIDASGVMHEAFTDGKVLFETGNNSRKLRVSFSSFKKAKFLDIRYYFLDKESGEFKPTAKGITVPDASVDEFADFLKNIREKI